MNRKTCQYEISSRHCHYSQMSRESMENLTYCCQRHVATSENPVWNSAVISYDHRADHSFNVASIMRTLRVVSDASCVKHLGNRPLKRPCRPPWKSLFKTRVRNKQPKSVKMSSKSRSVFRLRAHLIMPKMKTKIHQQLLRCQIVKKQMTSKILKVLLISSKIQLMIVVPRRRHQSQSESSTAEVGSTTTFLQPWPTANQPLEVSGLHVVGLCRSAQQVIPTTASQGFKLHQLVLTWTVEANDKLKAWFQEFMSKSPRFRPVLIFSPGHKFQPNLAGA